MEEVCDLNFQEKGIMAISYEDEQYGGYIGSILWVLGDDTVDAYKTGMNNESAI